MQPMQRTQKLTVTNPDIHLRSKHFTQAPHSRGLLNEKRLKNGKNGIGNVKSNSIGLFGNHRAAGALPL